MCKKEKSNFVLFLSLFILIMVISTLDMIADSYQAMLLCLVCFEAIGSIYFYELPKEIIDTKKILTIMSGIIASPLVIIINVAILYLLPPIILTYLLKRESDKKKVVFNNEWLVAMFISLSLSYTGLGHIKDVQNTSQHLYAVLITIGAIVFQMSTKLKIGRDDLTLKMEARINKWTFDETMKTFYIVIVIFLAQELMISSGFVYVSLLLLILRALEVTLRKIVKSNIKWKELLKDGLTGVYNKEFLRKRLADKIEEKESFSFIMIDLNSFKEVNDTFGHIVGDAVLIHFTNILQRIIRDGDIYRYGGDEFCVIVAGCDDTDAIISRIDNELNKTPYYIKDKELFLSASFGVVNSLNKVKSIDELISIADANMYKDKGERKIKCNYL